MPVLTDQLPVQWDVPSREEAAPESGAGRPSDGHLGRLPPVCREIREQIRQQILLFYWMDVKASTIDS